MILLLVLLSKFYENVKFIVITSFVFFLGFKYNIAMNVLMESIDLYHYEHYFNNINNIDIVGRYSFESGYVFLNRFLSFISFDFLYFFFFYHIVCISLLCFSFKKLKINDAYALLIYFSFLLVNIQFGLMRQSLAIVLFFVALGYLDRSTYKYMFFIFIASLFHRTALLFLVIPWIIKRKYNELVIILIVVISYLIYFKVFNFDLYTLLVEVTNTINIPLTNKLNYYLINMVDNNSLLNFSFIKQTLLLAVIFTVRNKLLSLRCYDSRGNILFNVSFIGLIMFFICNSISSITYRVEFYFIIFPYLFMLECSKLDKNELFKFIINTFVMLMCLIEVFRRYFIYGNFI